jgi:phosphomannomutase
MKYLFTINLLFFSLFASAQVPQRMSYQAVIRNANNTLLSQQLIGVRISILQADTAGQPVYVETHYTKTNLNGLMTLQIGGGLKFYGDFNSINWSTGRYFVKTETDPDGGFDYRITGYSELLSVPYALYAGGQTDTINLIKRINTKLSITDTTSMLAPYAKKEKLITKADLDSTNNFDINLKGNISSSKNVTVKGNIEALGSTSTLGTIDKPFKGLFLSAGSLSIASDTLGKNIPAAILSNVEGNLQISAGGLKLLNDASFIARNIQGELEGNASTATTLKTPRKINGVAFDGSVDILIDNSNESYVKKESLNGTVPFNMSIDGNFYSSKNVTVAGNIEALGSTSTLGTITKPFKGLYLSSGSLSIASDTLGQNVPAAVLSNVEGNLQISAGGVKLMGDNTSFIAPRIVGALTGNATTATKLQTARTINNIPFDGSANITIATTSPNSLTYTNTGTGDVPGGAYDGSLAKTISYNSIGASPLAGSSFITTVGTLTSGSIPFTLLSGTIPTWNQSTTGNAATATYATSAGSLSGTIPTWNQSTTGNAATATKLAATKNINGVAFDGSADINITAIADAGTLSGTTLNTTITGSSLTSVGTLANLTVTNPITGSVTGNAATATYATSAGSLSGTIPTWNQSTTGNAATATYATSAGSLSGTIPTWNQSTTGNAATATKLAATKNINGVAFDGSADINITAIADAGTLSGTTLNGTILNSSLTSVGTLANLTVTNPITGSVTGNAATATYATSAGSLSGTIPTWNQSTTGNAATATKLAATKNINGVAFDGSADINITAIADAGTLSGTTLNATITGSSLTSVGTLANLTVTNPITGSVTGNAATATYATSAGSLSGTIPTWNQSTTGNAATATKLAATKNINGVAFDGSADINITAIADAGTLSGTTLNTTITGSSLTSVGTLANLTVTNPITGSITGNAATATYATSAGSLSGTIPTWNQSTTGNAATATKLAATKNINGVAFDGSADINITAIADAGTLSGTTLNATITGSSLTSVGTITTGTWSGTNIGIAHGGTNTNATPTAGAIVYGNGTAYAISAAGTNGQYLQSAGTGAPTWAQPGPASIQVLSTSGTYTTPAGVKAIIIELVGGGGGSGAIAAAAGNNNGTVSGGGGSGSYTRALIINPASSYTYIIGLGGTASAIGVAGGNGGATSFNAGTITAPGGTGGAAGSTVANGSVSLGGAGGVAGIGGSFMVPGHGGGTGFSGSVISVAGAGANSYFGDGGVAPAVIDGTSRSGVAGSSFGAGASGAAAVNVGTGALGAAGFHGIIIVTEFK